VFSVRGGATTQAHNNKVPTATIELIDRWRKREGAEARGGHGSANVKDQMRRWVSEVQVECNQRFANHASYHLSLFLADEDWATEETTAALLLMGEHPVYDCIALHHGITISPLMKGQG